MAIENKLVWVTNEHKSAIVDGEVRYLNGVEGEPQATKYYTAAQLSDAGMVGIYKRDGDNNFQTIQRRAYRDVDESSNKTLGH